ncbi:MAG TPA: hypothetical protein VF037_05830 [Gemmatimonadales bacterium]
MRGPSRSALLPALFLPVLSACAHGEPFAADDFNTRVPFAATEPARLTLSPDPDLAPVWLPDGEGFVYSYARIDTPEGDRCLGVLPRTGGQRTREICRWTPEDADSIEALDFAAVSRGGRIAYVRTVAPLFNEDALRRSIVAGTLDDPSGGAVVRTIPFTTPDGAFITSVGELHWAGESRLVFTAVSTETIIPCPGCDAVAIQVPAGIAVLEADGSGTVALLAGTGDVTALTTDGDGSLLLARAGDTRIFRRELGTGEEAVVHDAGASISFLDAAGGRLLAQVPGGLHIVDLSSGAATDVGAPLLSRPALHPEGTAVVGEITDTATFNIDIWRLTIP